MTASKVRADYEQLTEIAQAFGHQAETAQRVLGALQKDLGALQGGDWLGKGSEAFYAEMSGAVLPSMERLVAALNEAASATQKVSRIMKQAEDDSAALFRMDGAGAGESGEEENGGPGTVVSRFGPNPGGAGGRSRSSALRSKIDEALKNPEVKFDDLKATLQAASQADRIGIWMDKPLMDKLKAQMSTEDYLALLSGLGPFQSGRVKHLTPTRADVCIKLHLGDYVENAIKDGRKASGSVSVVGGDDWELAGKAQYGDDWETKRLTLNAFVDDEGRVWVNKDRGNAGTLLHEALHKYDKDEIRKLSKPLNEGVTEYFTRKVIAAEDMKVARTQYQHGYDVTRKLIKMIGKDGEAVVAKAYFDGDVAGLKQAFLKAGKTEQQWSDFIQHTEDKDWDEAAGILD